MSHQFVAFLAGSVKAQGVVYVVRHGKGHRGVGAADAGTARVYQVFNAVVAAAFQNMCETQDFVIDVGEGVLDGIANASLRSQIDDSFWFVRFKAGFDCLPSREINP